MGQDTRNRPDIGRWVAGLVLVLEIDPSIILGFTSSLLLVLQNIFFEENPTARDPPCWNLALADDVAMDV